MAKRAQADVKRSELMTNAGYISSARTAKDGGWVVAYVAEEQGISAEDGGKYMIVCEQHSTNVQVETKAHVQVPRQQSQNSVDPSRTICFTDGMHGVACPDCGKQGDGV